MDKQIRFVLVYVLWSLVSSICWAAPLDLRAEAVAELINDNYLTVDDYLNDDMIVAFLRNGKIAPPKRWPNASVYYKISPDFDNLQVKKIQIAMAVIESVTCVRFYEAYNCTTTYVDIKAKEIGCVSTLGFRGGAQIFNLQKDIPKCFKVPVIMHELLHSLGFFHEHMSPDRDDYITIMWKNIKPDKEKWFKKLDKKTFMDFGFSYDYDSIMHYGRKGFSGNGLETILPLDTDAEIGQRLGLSTTDIGKINVMYNCSIEMDYDLE